MFVPLHEHQETKISVPATCPIDGHAEGYRRTAEESMKALTCGYTR
jgi:hypothetical protein